MTSIVPCLADEFAAAGPSILVDSPHQAMAWTGPKIMNVTTDDIRRCAMALPGVEETSHFRFRVPIWKVGGKTFLGMAKDETAAVFCVTEQEADEAASADPATYTAVRRQDTRRSFLGLQAELSRVSLERVRELAEKAWHCQAPKALTAGPGRGSSAPRSSATGSSAPRRGLFLVGGPGSRQPGRSAS